MSPLYGDKIQSMFYIFNQTFEAMWNPYDKIYDK